MAQLIETYTDGEQIGSYAVPNTKHLNRMINYTMNDIIEKGQMNRSIMLHGTESELTNLGATCDKRGKWTYESHNHVKISCKVVKVQNKTQSSSSRADRYAIETGDVYIENESWNIGLDTTKPRLFWAG